MTPPHTAHLLARHTGYQGFFRLSRYEVQFARHDGTLSPPVEREVFERGDAVMVIPYDAMRRQVLLVEQFRAGAYAHLTQHGPNGQSGPWLMEFPAGMIDPGQTAREAACRELREETGLMLGDEPAALRQIYSYYTSPGGCSERITLFMADVDLSTYDTTRLHGNDHEHEDIRTHIVAVEALASLVAGGRINDASTLLGVTWVQSQMTHAT